MELRNEYKFVGRAKISGGWSPALVLLQKDFKLVIYLPWYYDILNDNEIPEIIEGQIEGWDLRIQDGFISGQSRNGIFHQLTERNPFTIDVKTVSATENGKKLWTEMTLLPQTITFSKVGNLNSAPDNWGLSFYPEDSNKQLWYLFAQDRNPTMPPNLLSAIGRRFYFANSEKWSLEEIRERLKLITSCCSLFTSAPVSYQLLIGRNSKEVICFQVQNFKDSKAFVCPSTYNGCIRIKGEFLKNFMFRFLKRIQDVYSNDDIDKINVILSYFTMLHTSFYDEAKIALSYMIMESLAKYKKLFVRKSRRTAKKQLKELNSIRERLCSSCWPIIEGALNCNVNISSDDLDVLIEKASDVIKTDDQLKIPTSAIRGIMRHYRNQAFHGDFFEDMNEVERLLAELPDGYRDDFPIVCQAIVNAIGAHLILGIGFEEMIAVKRKLNDDD